MLSDTIQNGQSTPQKQRLHGIDGLRGILALLVAISHYSGHMIGWDPKRPLANVGLAVDTFFIMSGLVLAYSYHGKYKFTLSAFSHFMGVRLFRLFPLGLFTTILVPLICFVVLKEWLPHWICPKLTLAAILTNLTMTQMLWYNYFGEIPICLNQPIWSASVELWVATVLVFFGLFCRPVLCLLVAIGFYIYVFSESSIYSFHSIRGIAGISLGISIYHFFYANNLCESWKGKAGVITFLSLGYCLAVCCSGGFLSSYGYMSGILAASVAVCLIPFDSGVVSKLLNCRIILYFGKISFSVYLIHAPLIYVFLYFKGRVGLSQNLAIFLSWLVVTLVTSHLLWKYLEIPVYQYGKKWIGDR
jgi:peptidoglycan/LPS O-acetylase OafA/YrhL